MKNNNLEAVRGVAAISVVLGHLVQKIPELSANKNHYLNFFTNWATEAVIVFFILSGIVIHSSFERKPRSTFTFLLQRITRLHPTLLISVLLCVVLENILFKNAPTFKMIAFNLIPLSTLSGNLMPVFWNSNPVIWTLTYEVFFYVFFAVFVIQSKKTNKTIMKIWFVISLISIRLYYLEFSSDLISHLVQMFAFSSIWIVGFYIFTLKKYLTPNLYLAVFSLLSLPIISRLHLTDNYYDPLKYFLFSLNSIPIFIYLIEPTTKKIALKRQDYYLFSLVLVIYLVAVIKMLNDDMYLPSIKMLYIIFPFFNIIMVVNWVRQQLKSIYKNLVRPFFAYLGKLSYPLYLLHFPIIIFIYRYFSFSVSIKICLIIILVFIVSYTIEKFLQPLINRILLKTT